MKRAILLISSLLIVAGLVLYWLNGRIFATFLVDLVFGTISPTAGVGGRGESFSWGIKVWGNMNAELARASIGFGLVALGQLVLIPQLAPGSRGLVKIGLVVAFAAVTVSGALAAWAGLGTMGAFGVLAGEGQADPVAFANGLPVPTADLAHDGLVFGGMILAMLGLLVGFSGKPSMVGSSSGKRVTAWVSASGLVGFAGCLLAVGFGPLTEVMSGPRILDPVTLARQIREALALLVLGSGCLVLAGVMGLVSVLLPAASVAP